MGQGSATVGVQVRREGFLLDDTLIQIQNAGARRQLKFPLRVKFANEEAVDEGGVQKVLPSTYHIVVLCGALA